MRITGMYESNNAADNGAAATVRTAAQAVSRLPLRDSIENAVQNYVSSGRNDGSLYEAAVLLGINRGTLRKKLKKYGIN